MDSASEKSLREMPSAMMAEKSVISMAMKNLRMVAMARAEGIDAGCFHFPATRTVWLAVCEYVKSRPDAEESDMGLMIQSLTNAGQLERAGGPSMMAELWTYAPHVGGFSEWCGTLREMKARRLAKTHATKLDECEDADEAIAATRIAFEDLQKTIAGKSKSRSGKEAAEAFLAKFKADHEAGDMPGKSTGLHEIDNICGGMRPGEFWVIGGKPSMGKSVLMLQIAEAFLSRGETVAVFSLEMMESEIVGRLVTLCGRVKYGAITQPKKATKGDFPKIARAIKAITESKIWINDAAGMGIDSIASEAEAIRDRSGDIGLVVVDYLQLMRGGRARGESREEEVARASGGLKQLAKRLGCPVLSASQLNEDGKTRESRAIEQDADALIGIFEDGLKIGKMRNSKRGQTLPLYLNGELQRFNPKYVAQ